MSKRFETLDALRGFAALTVLLYHSTVLYGPPCTTATSCRVPFGYLAVDLFFALSGFVIAHSYDQRLEAGMTVRDFMGARLRRLAPIYLVGLAVGLVPPIRTAVEGLGGGKHTMISAAFGALFLPGPSWSKPALPFPLDPPAWSLFFELWVANLIYVLGHRALRGRVLGLVILASGLALVVAQRHYGSLDLGSVWSSFWGGFPRVLFSFLVGVALRRWRTRTEPPILPAWIIIAGAVASFWIPVLPGLEKIYESAMVLLVYPIVIFLGSAASTRRPRAGHFLGDLSYALYVLHVPLVVVTSVIIDVSHQKFSPLAYGAYLISTVGASWLLARLDLKLQARLKRRRLSVGATSPDRPAS